MGESMMPHVRMWERLQSSHVHLWKKLLIVLNKHCIKPQQVYLGIHSNVLKVKVKSKYSSSF